MRILIYGAGVIGANLAADMYSSGADVTVLARGEWADTLENKGLVIAPVFSFRKRAYRVPVVRELKKEDAYDAIFVVMRYTQLGEVIQILADNISENIVFIGNNLSVREHREKLKGKNVFYGFSMAAGHREKDRVVSISLRKITVGQLDEHGPGEALMRQIFKGTKIKLSYQPNMGDYLLCHAACVVPIAFACYYCGGDLKKIKSDGAYLNRLIDANIEGLSAIENAGHEILPSGFREYRGGRFRRKLFLMYKLMCLTGIGKICASDHALNAVEEMSALNDGLKSFYDSHRAAYPNYQRLEAGAGRYIHKRAGS